MQAAPTCFGSASFCQPFNTSAIYICNGTDLLLLDCNQLLGLSQGGRCVGTPMVAPNVALVGNAACAAPGIPTYSVIIFGTSTSLETAPGTPFSTSLSTGLSTDFSSASSTSHSSQSQESVQATLFRGSSTDYPATGVGTISVGSSSSVVSSGTVIPSSGTII